jgi:hypothetical protein
MFCGGREKNSTCIRTHCICTKMAILSKAMYQIMYPKDRELFATPRMRCAAPQAAASLTRVFRIDDPPQTLSSKLICECKLKNKLMRILRQPKVCLAKLK